MLQHLPNELIPEIFKYLSLNECLKIKHVIKYKDTNKNILYKSKLFYSSYIIQKISINYDIYKLLKNSSFNGKFLYDLLYKIDKKEITNDNKIIILNLVYYNDNILNDDVINNTINIIKIMLIMTENYIDEKNFINNPYCYFYTILNSILIDYLTDVIYKKYKKIIKHHIVMKFKQITFYEKKWYNDNTNIYEKYLNYLLITSY